MRKKKETTAENLENPENTAKPCQNAENEENPENPDKPGSKSVRHVSCQVTLHVDNVYVEEMSVIVDDQAFCSWVRDSIVWKIIVVVVRCQLMIPKASPMQSFF